MFETMVLAGPLHMGERNVVACRMAIRETGLVIAGEDVGGHRGRSILFDVSDGTVAVRMLGAAERYV
jgi:chemotaxis protein CheD